MAFEAYNVAIKLSLHNMVSSGLSRVAKDLTGLEKNAVNLQNKIKALKMIGVGWGISKVGSGMIGFLEQNMVASKDYTHQIAQLNIMGLKSAQVNEIVARSWKTSRDVITTSAADNIEAFREMYGAFGAGHEEEALAVLPYAQRASAIIASVTGKMTSVKDVGYDIAKATELTSRIVTDAQLEKRTEQFLNAAIAFGGRVNTNDFHQALKMTRGAAIHYSDEFISKYFPSLIQEMKTGNGGASQAGVLLRNFNRAVIGQVIPLNKLTTWDESGLIRAGHVVWNKNHKGVKYITPGGVDGQGIASENPYEWWNRFGEKAVDKLMKKRHISDIQAISALAPNQMVLDLFTKFHFQKAQYERDRKLIEQVTNAGGSAAKYEQLLKTDPNLAQLALHKQWENIQARIGFELLPRLIPLMSDFTDALSRVSQWMQRNPQEIKYLVAAFGGLGFSMIILGKSLMLVGLVKLAGIGRSLSTIATASSGAALGLADINKVADSGMKKRLLSVGGALRALSAAASVFVAWQAGTAAGDWINSKLSKESKNWIGEQVATAAAWLNIGDSREALRINNPDRWARMNGMTPGFTSYSDAMTPRFPGMYSSASVPVPPKQPITVQTTTTLHLDGKQIATTVTREQAKAASRPQSGTSQYDISMGYPGPGMNSSIYLGGN